MTEAEKIKQEILDWIDQNRHQLPLNIDSWHVNVFKTGKSSEKSAPIKLGKYNAALDFSHPFYKPYTKMFILKNGK